MARRARLTVSLVAVGALAACTSTAPEAAGPTPGPTAVSAASASPSATGSAPAAAAFSPGATSIGDSLFPKEGNGGYDVTHYDITIAYDPASTVLTGRVKVAATATQALSRFDLDLHGLTVKSVSVDGVAATFAHPAEKLQVTPAAGLAAGAAFTADIAYGGKPSEYQDPVLGLEGFIPSEGGAPGALAQGEPDVAAAWFPVNDHPRDKASYDVTITAPKALAAISNGVLVSKVATGADLTWHWRESAPMASYLALVAIGRYRVHTSTHGGLPVVTAVDASLPTSYDTQLARTPEVIDFLAGYFGPYPFDSEGGVIHADHRLNFALENQSRPAYAPGFFKDPDAAWVIAHEEAHQWFGDSVSVHDWKDLWLNEGFATYAEWLWSEHVGNGTPKQIFDRMYRAGEVPPGTPGSPDLHALFDDTVYQRGGATLEALRITVGDATFFKILKGWGTEHHFGNASTEDFTAYAQRVSGKDLSALFKAWLYTRGKPPYPKARS